MARDYEGSGTYHDYSEFLDTWLDKISEVTGTDFEEDDIPTAKDDLDAAIYEHKKPYDFLEFVTLGEKSEERKVLVLIDRMTNAWRRIVMNGHGKHDCSWR